MNLAGGGPGRPRPAETRQAASLQECFSVTYANSFLPGACFDHLANAGARLGFRLSNRGKRTIDREMVFSGYQKLLGRKAGDDFVASFRDDDFFLDASSTPAVGRGPEGFQ